MAKLLTSFRKKINKKLTFLVYWFDYNIRSVFLNLFLFAEPFGSKKISAEPLNQSDFFGGTPKT
jgi:hypothetical protein